ncbi:unnamed protein product [Chrysoparadoxa australica]
MRALLCEEFAPPRELVLKQSLPSLTPRKGEVVLSVSCCGINFPDYLLVQGKYQVRPPRPFSPGSEVSGSVKSLGAGVSSVSIGDRVMCMIPHGGLADEVVVPAAEVIKIPDEMDDEQAAAFIITSATTYFALSRRCKLLPGERLLVLGASGGVGIAAIQLGVALGAEVIAAASSERKLEVCRNAGATHTINYGKDGEGLKAGIARISGRRAGVDVVYDPVGGKLTQQAVRGLAMYGRLLVVGFAAGEIPKLPLNLLLLKQASAVGVFMGQWAQRKPQEYQLLLSELLEFFKRGDLRPVVTRVFPLSEGAAAIELLGGRQATGKVVVRVARERARL